MEMPLAFTSMTPRPLRAVESHRLDRQGLTGFVGDRSARFHQITPVECAAGRQGEYSANSTVMPIDAV